MVTTQTPTTLPPRSTIAKEYTWNAESVFISPAHWAQAADDVIAAIPQVQQFKGRLAESADTLANYLAAAEQLTRKTGKVFVYASMSSAADTGDQEATAMAGQARGLYGRVMAAIAFGRPEMLAIGRETLEKWMDEEPRLASYRQYVDNLFRTAQHVRSAEVEEVLGMVSDPFATVQTTYTQLTNADLKFAPAVADVTDEDGVEHEVTQGTLGRYLSSSDRGLRRSAWENYMDGHLAFKNTLASSLLTSVKQDVFRARVRGYPTCLEASLFENNIPVEVFHNLINTFKRNIPTWHKYWRVKRQAMKLDSIHTYDVWAPISADTEPHVPYAQAVEWIAQGMEPLGSDYVNAMRKGCLEDRWVDVYPNQGKRQGAFSSGVHDTHPFIMMSYNDTLGAMSTLAHELGHSMHSYYSRKTQPAMYSGYSLFVAEVASNFNQAMTRARLMQTQTDPNFQIALIQEAMGNFHRYFFIMPLLAQFELEVHTRAEQGKGITAGDLNGLMADLFAEGYGEEMTLDRERDGITWATFGHLYSNYYVYQYATGISAAHALSEKILAGDADAAKRYVEFLSLGSSAYPLQALAHAGVDMTSPEAVETTFAVFARYVDRLEELTQ
ncbi:MAG: oligoendopeptidase F [bacterium]|nr:oligoendopeptidase F [bacterium]